MEIIDIINNDDEVIGQATKEEIYEKLLTHRIVHILLFNKNGEIASQQQSATKGFCPLHWNSSAAGHVQSGETYEQAAVRELEEEIGVKLPVKFIGKFVYPSPSVNNFNKFIAVFKADYDGPFKINLNDVSQVRYFSLVQIKSMINNGELMHPEFKYLLNLYFKI